VIVIDASAAVELLLRTPRGVRVAKRIADDGGPVFAPHVIDPEVMQAFRDLVRARQVELPRADAALAAFAKFPLRRVPHDVLWTRMWALRANVTAYDAAYVVVAELAGAPLITSDARLSRAPGHGAKIELL
jgi:predicted nucleic acid-binding protein